MVLAVVQWQATLLVRLLIFHGQKAMVRLLNQSIRLCSQAIQSIGGTKWHRLWCTLRSLPLWRASGADPNYPLKFGTINQEIYVAANTDKYDIQFGVTDTKDLLPGDILIVNEGAHMDATGKIVVPQTHVIQGVATRLFTLSPQPQLGGKK